MFGDDSLSVEDYFYQRMLKHPSLIVYDSELNQIGKDSLGFFAAMENFQTFFHAKCVKIPCRDRYAIRIYTKKYPFTFSF